MAAKTISRKEGIMPTTVAAASSGSRKRATEGKNCTAGASEKE
jgi:hypothetical protein